MRALKSLRAIRMMRSFRLFRGRLVQLIGVESISKVIELSHRNDIPASSGCPANRHCVSVQACFVYQMMPIDIYIYTYIYILYVHSWKSLRALPGLRLLVPWPKLEESILALSVTCYRRCKKLIYVDLLFNMRSRHANASYHPFVGLWCFSVYL